MSEGAHDKLKKVKTIYRFHKLVFDRGDSNLECFNRATQKYGLWQSILVRYHTREKRFLCLLSLTRRDNERRGVHVPWFSQWWLKFVLFSNACGYIFVCYFIYPDKSESKNLYAYLQDCVISSVEHGTFLMTGVKIMDLSWCIKL